MSFLKLQRLTGLNLNKRIFHESKIYLERKKVILSSMKTNNKVSKSKIENKYINLPLDDKSKNTFGKSK